MTKPASNPGWRRLLRTTKNGEIAASSNNAYLVLRNDPAWQNVLAYDSFAGDIVMRRKAPWPKSMQPAVFETGDWTDNDTWRAKMWIAQTYAFEPNLHEVGGALKVLSDQTSFHPVTEWLTSLRFRSGKTSSIETWLIDFAGVEDTPYTRAVGRNFLIAAVARAFEPGCQVDDMPIFEGDQGIGKTTMLRVLAGNEWFMSTNMEIGSKDGYQALRRKWIVEFGELDAMSRSEISRVKQFVSQMVDRYRPSYGQRAIDFYRQCVFAGTVNPEAGGYLKDQTGARRFRPIFIPRAVDLAGLAKARDQLWAEAVQAFKKGIKWHIHDADILREAAAVAEERRQADPREAIVGEWLAKQGPAVRASGVTTHLVMERALELEKGKLGKADEMVVSAALVRAGWVSNGKERIFGSAPVRVYRPLGSLKAIKGGKYIEKEAPKGGTGGYGRKPKTR